MTIVAFFFPAYCCLLFEISTLCFTIWTAECIPKSNAGETHAKKKQRQPPQQLTWTVWHFRQKRTSKEYRQVYVIAMELPTPWFHRGYNFPVFISVSVNFSWLSSVRWYWRSTKNLFLLPIKQTHFKYKRKWLFCVLLFTFLISLAFTVSCQSFLILIIACAATNNHQTAANLTKNNNNKRQSGELTFSPLCNFRRMFAIKLVVG